MTSSGCSRDGLGTAGGILSIVAGTLEIAGGVMIGALSMGLRVLLRLALVPLLPSDWLERIPPVMPTLLSIAGVPLVALGIVAIIGGVSAVRRKNWSLSLAGAICALPSHILGILAVIFVSVSKREFEAKE